MVVDMSLSSVKGKQLLFRIARSVKRVRGKGTSSFVVPIVAVQLHKVSIGNHYKADPFQSTSCSCKHPDAHPVMYIKRAHARQNLLSRTMRNKQPAGLRRPYLLTSLLRCCSPFPARAPSRRRDLPAPVPLRALAGRWSRPVLYPLASAGAQQRHQHLFAGSLRTECYQCVFLF